jgi:hypothetical protein
MTPKSIKALKAACQQACAAGFFFVRAFAIMPVEYADEDHRNLNAVPVRILAGMRAASIALGDGTAGIDAPLTQPVEPPTPCLRAYFLGGVTIRISPPDPCDRYTLPAASTTPLRAPWAVGYEPSALSFPFSSA